jgi:hypothetical protein
MIGIRNTRTENTFLPNDEENQNTPSLQPSRTNKKQCNNKRSAPLLTNYLTNQLTD